MTHSFIFSPGTWLGEGIISFSYSPEKLRFYTRWEITPISSELEIHCQQTVQIVGFEEKTINTMTILPKDDLNFIIRWKNEFLEVEGSGKSDPKTLQWEFVNNPEYEGWEQYTLQDNGHYHFHAEYGSLEFRTSAEGKIWRKAL